MKKRILIITTILTTAIGITSCSSEDNSSKENNIEIISKDQLPAKANSFLTNTFPNNQVKQSSKATQENYYGSLYSTTLDNALKIDFDVNGNWTEVEMTNKGAIAPTFLEIEVPTIKRYVENNYPTNYIIEIDKKQSVGYEVELNNSLELIFDFNQNFINLDIDVHESEEPIEFNALPALAKEFIQTNFPNEKTTLIKKETDDHMVDYKVYFNSSLNIEFDVNGQWTQIEYSRTANLFAQNTYLPKALTEYIKKNYTNHMVESVELEYNKYTVELNQGNSDIELVFDNNGTFVRIDY